MATLELVDGEGDVLGLSCSSGDTLFQSLLRNHVPPESVVVLEDDDPVALTATVQSGRTYRAYLMERYDVMAQADRYGGPDAGDAATVSRYLSLGDDVRIDGEGLSLEELAAAVERRLVEVVERYGLFEAEETVAVAYSGGIDSSALLLALTAVADELPEITLRTMTIADYWTGEDAAPGRDLIDELDVHNDVLSPDRLVELYGLDRSPGEALARVRDRRTPVDALSVANSFNRRLFEAYAAEHDADAVCIGDHASDFIAGFVGGLFGGVDRSPDRIPVHRFGPVRYVYPLAFHTKQQLTLYRYARTGRLVENTGFDPWQMNTAYRHFYYYLADLVQSYCPGAIHWLAADEGEKDEDAARGDYEACRNCGKSKRPADLDAEGTCAVCRTLAGAGLLD